MKRYNFHNRPRPTVVAYLPPVVNIASQSFMNFMHCHGYANRWKNHEYSLDGKSWERLVVDNIQFTYMEMRIKKANAASQILLGICLGIFPPSPFLKHRPADDLMAASPARAFKMTLFLTSCFDDHLSATEADDFFLLLWLNIKEIIRREWWTGNKKWPWHYHSPAAHGRGVHAPTCTCNFWRTYRTGTFDSPGDSTRKFPSYKQLHPNT